MWGSASPSQRLVAMGSLVTISSNTSLMPKRPATLHVERSARWSFEPLPPPALGYGTGRLKEFRHPPPGRICVATKTLRNEPKKTTLDVARAGALCRRCQRCPRRTAGVRRHESDDAGRSHDTQVAVGPRPTFSRVVKGPRPHLSRRTNRVRHLRHRSRRLFGVRLLTT